MFLPACEGVGGGARTAFLLHGILGSRGNWRGFARRLARRAPDWRFVVVDLRNHGDSHGALGPHTLSACAADLAHLGSQFGRPEVVVGHSFGGKVALVYAREYGAGLRVVWSLDSPPGPRTGVSGEVEAVIDAIRLLPTPAPSRNAVSGHFRTLGFSELLAGWMTTNLRPTEGGFVWRFDLDAVVEMLEDYGRQDLRPFVRAAPMEVRLLRAGRSDRWAPEDAALATDVLPDAGHWVHVDDPAGLAELLSPSFG